MASLTIASRYRSLGAVRDAMAAEADVHFRERGALLAVRKLAVTYTALDSDVNRMAELQVLVLEVCRCAVAKAALRN